jgi:hypothetical protein
MHYFRLLGVIFTAVGACADHPFDYEPAAARALKALWNLQTLKQGHNTVANVIKYTHTTEELIDKLGFSYKEAGRATSGLSNLETRDGWTKIPPNYVELDSERGGRAIIQIDPLNLVVRRKYQIAYKVDELDGRQPDSYEFNAPAPPDVDAPETPDSSSGPDLSTTDLGPTYTESDTSPTETGESISETTVETTSETTAETITETTTETASVETSDQPSVTSTASTGYIDPDLISFGYSLPAGSTETEESSETPTSSTSSESPTDTDSGAPGAVHGSSGPGWSLFLFLASLFV